MTKKLILRLLSFVVVFTGTLIVGDIGSPVVKAVAATIDPQTNLPLSNDQQNFPSSEDHHNGRNSDHPY